MYGAGQLIGDLGAREFLVAADELLEDASVLICGMCIVREGTVAV